MITIKDINKAFVKKITDALKETEYKDVKFTSKDITEEIPRPCFYFDLGTTNTVGKATWKLKERQLECYIYYFCKDNKERKIDLLTMQGLLEEILIGNLVVNGSFLFQIEDCNFDYRHKDGYLQATVSLYSLEEIEIIDNYEPMENLHLNIRRE